MKKKQLVELLREVMNRWGIRSAKQLADLTGISVRTAQRLLNIDDAYLHVKAVLAVFSNLIKLAVTHFPPNEVEAEQERLQKSMTEFGLSSCLGETSQTYEQRFVAESKRHKDVI